MRAVIYKLIQEALQSLIIDNKAAILHIDLFNEQVLYSEEEQAFYTPAVFIEFGTIDWQKQLHGVRDAVVTVRLHIVTDCRAGRWEDALNRLKLCDNINRQLHALNATIQGIGVEEIEENFSVSKNTDTRQLDRPCSVINDITLYRSTTNHNFGELADDIEEYQCHITDASAYNRF